MNIKFRRFVAAAGILLFAASGITTGDDIIIPGPDGHLKCLLTQENDQLYFSVYLDNTTVIDRSPVRMYLNSAEITRGVRPGKVKNFSEDSTYPLFGYHSRGVNKFNGTTISLRNKALKI